MVFRTPPHRAGEWSWCRWRRMGTDVEHYPGALGRDFDAASADLVGPPVHPHPHLGQTHERASRSHPPVWARGSAASATLPHGVGRLLAGFLAGVGPAKNPPTC